MKVFSIEDNKIRMNGKPMTREDAERLCVCGNIFMNLEDPTELLLEMRRTADLASIASNGGLNVSFVIRAFSTGLHTLNLGG